MIIVRCFWILSLLFLLKIISFLFVKDIFTNFVHSYMIQSRTTSIRTTSINKLDIDGCGLLKSTNHDLRRCLFPRRKHKQILMLSSRIHLDDDDANEQKKNDNSNNDKDRLDNYQFDANRRRYLTGSGATTTMMMMTMMTSLAPDSYAAITDETDTFAENWWTTPSDGKSSSSSTTTTTDKITSTPTLSDEISIIVNKDIYIKQNGLGIELSDIEFKTALRVYVKSVKSNSYGEQLGIQKNWIVIGINNQSMERTNTKGIATYLNQAIQNKNNNSKDIIIRFRDPSIFRQKLQSLKEDEVIATQVAPGGDTTQYIKHKNGSINTNSASKTISAQTDQIVTVTQLKAAPICSNGGAHIDDLLEISYIGSVIETGDIFDGSAIKINDNGIPGRGDDTTLYFVLGKQPFGQFPPGWDVGLYGICIGERRRLIIPSSLGYGTKGLPRRNIPPNATLQYDVTLVSLNGFSTIQ